MSRNATIIAAAVIVMVFMSLLAVAGAADAADAPKEKDAPSAVKKIEIKDRKYSPAKITIKEGTTVVWTNRDDSDHTIVSADGSFGTKDNDLSRGESYKFTFTKKGKYRYHCKYHPREKGEIIVE